MPGTMTRPITANAAGRRREDPGFSLVELMVAIVIFSIVGGIVTAALVSSNKAARTTSNSVQTQARLVDAMTHIGRDLSDSSVITVASPSGLETRGLVNGHCVVSVFTASGTSLSEKRTTLADTTCPATGGTADGSTPTTKVLVSGLTATTVFTYFDTSNNGITAAINAPSNPRVDSSSVKRVQYTVSAGVAGRSPRVLTSAITLQSVSP